MATKEITDDIVYKGKVEFQDYIRMWRIPMIGGRSRPSVIETAADIGGTWIKIANPSTDWLGTKTSGWTADNFDSGMEIDFSDYVPTGVIGVWVFILQQTTLSSVYGRKSGDTNVSNTPAASNEWSHLLMTSSYSGRMCWLELSLDHKTQIAVTNVATDIYVAYPRNALL